MAIQTKPLTGDRYIDGMLQGSYWSDTSLVFSMSDGWNGETWNAPDAMAAEFLAAAYQMTRYTALDGQWLGFHSDPNEAYLAGADINLTVDANNVAFAGSPAWARGFFPSTTPEIHAGDIYLNARSEANTLPSYAPGSQGYFVLLHELGHALGLKHPHDDGGTNRPTFTELDIADWDFNLFTVMSYNDTNFDLVNYNPATPMILDVLALQHLYGVNTALYQGATDWQLSETNQYQTLFDPSGVNSLDLGESETGWTVYLPDQTIGDSETRVGWAHTGDDPIVPSTFFWLAGNYQNATGGRLGDVLIGNRDDNRLDGGPGADRMTGGLGDDVYVVDHSEDQILELPFEGTDQIILADLESFEMPSHVEILYIETEASVIIRGNGSDNVLHLGTQPVEFDGVTGRNEVNIATDQRLESIEVFNDGMRFQFAAGQRVVVQETEQVSTPTESYELAALEALADSDEALRADIAALYIAYFDRAPDAEGLRYWVGERLAGMSLEAVAESFYEQPESVSVRGLAPETLIENAYQQIFDRAPDFAGATYWETELESGAITTPHFLLALSQAARSATADPEDAARLNEHIDRGLQYAWRQGEEDLDIARALLDIAPNETSGTSEPSSQEQLLMLRTQSGEAPSIQFLGQPLPPSDDVFLYS